MEFPDPKPSREEMIETYLQTLAKVVGSYEEAKKRMYAFSTTTYIGFQAVMTEEMSEKFRGLPGVVFILPDSYLYPETKEYGGDKYDNGVITPRPPPVHYSKPSRMIGIVTTEETPRMALHSKEITRTAALHKEVIRIARHSKETSRHTALSKMEEAIPHSRIMHKVYRMLEVLGGMIMQTVQVTVDHLVASKVKHLGTQGIQLVKVKVTATPKSAGTSRKAGRSFRPGGTSPPGSYGQPSTPGSYGQPSPPGSYGQPSPPGSYGQPSPPGSYGQPSPPGNYGQGPPSYPGGSRVPGVNPSYGDSRQGTGPAYGGDNWQRGSGQYPSPDEGQGNWQGRQ
ncbi:hypothetical protein PAHAL_1G109800 [Panicum hallii]|uniref:MORF/ORRM1/DAG-like MORF domain-containing protein n=1 Tax=Panicum hallii TaxID=206008 RepID=A0A2T8KUU3_9POAL|nr:hypothetical protein PAHAL_1G109800 [Panicum hallii]